LNIGPSFRCTFENLCRRKSGAFGIILPAGLLFMTPVFYNEKNDRCIMMGKKRNNNPKLRTRSNPV
jgi:hypothetical protein